METKQRRKANDMGKRVLMRLSATFLAQSFLKLDSPLRRTRRTEDVHDRVGHAPKTCSGATTPTRRVCTGGAWLAQPAAVQVESGAEAKEILGSKSLASEVPPDPLESTEVWHRRHHLFLLLLIIFLKIRL